MTLVDSRLQSWKEIAQYLQRDVRTVIRWEQEKGLPVHRVPGGKQPRVFAYRHELDVWLAGSPLTDGPSVPPPDITPAELSVAPHEQAAAGGGASATRRVTPVAASLAVLALSGLAIATVLTLTSAGYPARLAVIGRELRALDAAGKTRWAHVPDAVEALPGSGRWDYLGDLDGDQEDDVLAVLQQRPSSSTPFVDSLLRFSIEGRRGWSITPDDRVTFRAGEYGPPWSSAYMRPYEASGRTRIAWAVHHYTWWPALLITLDPQGKRLGTFVNSGWIDMVDQSADRRHLLISGTNNERDGHFFAVLDADRPTGRSPEPPGSATECLDCPSGDPLRYVVFRRTDVAQHQKDRIAMPTIQVFEDGRVFVHVHQSSEPGIASVIYELSTDYTVGEVRFSDTFWKWHRTLEEEGLLKHGASDCPERRTQIVEVWSPGTGWHTTNVPVR